MASLSVADYVKQLGGTVVIEKVLIANNGIAAVKAIRSIHQWAYRIFGDMKAIQFVVMATPDDIKANAEYIRLADEFEEVPGGSNNNNYANVQLIVDIAERTGVQAVWAGWGHASENPDLPSSLARAGIAFLGPPAGPMRDLGDKISSTILAQSAQVPTVPWSGDGLVVDYSKEGIPDKIVKEATVSTIQQATEIVEKIGLPVMIKASEGGGGKGIRRINKLSDIALGFEQVQKEVPGSPIFIMKVVQNCHHLEVQIVGDQYGEALALYGRDCSVQRRHQKIIEEGPAIAAPPALWEEMQQAAVRLTKLVGYVGVGTVEYLYADGKYTFLELNPRLQVEHPVSEQITDVNLPATQLQVAMGIPLSKIPDIRRWYGLTCDTEPLDFTKLKPQPPRGHVIAVRITAENPAQGFKPTSGHIQDLTFRSTPNVWGYFSVGRVGGLHEFADSQFGHLFAWGPTRDDSRKCMVMALKEVSIRGEIHTPVEYLINLLETEEFRHNRIHTEWLDELIAKDSLVDIKPSNLLVVFAAAVMKATALHSARTSHFIGSLAKGRVLGLDYLRTYDYLELIYLNVRYKIHIIRTGPNHFALSTAKNFKDIVEAETRPLTDGGVLLLINGKSHVCYGGDEGSTYRLILDGKTLMFADEYDPTALKSNTPGKLVRYLVEEGAEISVGTCYAEVEVMKMYLPLVSQEAGIIHFVAPEGSKVEVGTLIATLKLSSPTDVKSAVDYSESFPKIKPPRHLENKPHHLLRSSIKALQNILGGYKRPSMKQLVDDFFKYLCDERLALFEYREVLAALSTRLPTPLVDALNRKLEDFDQSLKKGKTPFPGAELKKIIDDFLASDAQYRSTTFETLIAPLVNVASKFVGGLFSNLIFQVKSLLEEYCKTESLFLNHRSREQALLELTNIHKDDLLQVYNIAFAKNKESQRSQIILLILEAISSFNPENLNSSLSRNELLDPFVHVLRELSLLTGKGNIEVSLKARQVLVRYQLRSFHERKASVQESFKHNDNIPQGSKLSLDKLTDSIHTESSLMFDVLSSLFFHKDENTRKLAMEVYVRSVYRSYSLNHISSFKDEDLLYCEWVFANEEPTGKSAPILSPHSRTNRLVMSESFDGGSSLRYGAFVCFETLEEVQKNFDKVLSLFKPALVSSEEELLNVLKVYIKEELTEEAVASLLPGYLRTKAEKLRSLGMRRVTFLLGREGEFPSLLTFRERQNFQEDQIYRNIEPPLGHNMELKRLANYDIQRYPCGNQAVHLYYAQQKGKPDSDPSRDRRFFARAEVRSGQVSGSSTMKPHELIINEVERILVESIKALEIAIIDNKYKETSNNHIFLLIPQEVVFEPMGLDPLVRELGRRYGESLWKLRVTELEVVAKLKQLDQPTYPIRLIAVNPSGYSFNISVYIETKVPGSSEMSFISVGKPGPLHLKPTMSPYPLTSSIQRKRFFAQKNDTTYIYDFPELFLEALRGIWATFRSTNPNHVNPIASGAPLLLAYELVLDETGELKEVIREPGSNRIGMVVWRMRLLTPEYPDGREIIVVGNDITHQIGSFGPDEDVLFYKASQLARSRGIPRVYLACNSGARIGLAQEVKDLFKISWNDPQDPTKGFKYLYLSDKDYQTLSAKGSVNAVKIQDDKWQIIDIIGEEEGLGVENLRGSGMIAGETSRAYDEIFTITLVTGRTVGIGAYLVRLGQRTVQNQGPVILTGAPALNKVLGKEVYSSNVQLGGPQIMYANGVSHIDVNDELKGIHTILNWLSYVPKRSKAPLPILPTQQDLITERSKIQYYPPRQTPSDPRLLFTGQTDSDGKWLGGFFDRGSFTETLAGWAKTAIIGRARLGGIPIGVITCETRTVELVKPADPANPDSQQSVVQQSGQVWFPDSAYKTAQAIQDFDREHLPLIIFANWRGFSGGMRDMYDEILKFGSYIVDALQRYKSPVFVYIPPGGELRGGAWVVLDPTINPEMMEMYADSDSRGGVLEPSGTVEIKFRDRDILKTMHRLDPLLLRLKDMKTNKTSDSSDSVNMKIKEREEKLFNVYTQAATSFADLHDTPGRMKAKGVISGVISWEDARSFFYYRLSRRLAEEELRTQISQANASLTHDHTSQLIEDWCFELLKSSGNVSGSIQHFKDLPNQEALEILNGKKTELKAKIDSLSKEYALKQLAETLKRTDALEIIQQLLTSDHIDDNVKEFIKSAVSRN